MVAYAELHCLSHFSFQRGALREELVTRAAALGYQALALTDECSVAGVVRAHAALRALPEPRPALIIGSEFRARRRPETGAAGLRPCRLRPVARTDHAGPACQRKGALRPAPR